MAVLRRVVKRRPTLAGIAPIIHIGASSAENRREANREPCRHHLDLQRHVSLPCCSPLNPKSEIRGHNKIREIRGHNTNYSKSGAQYQLLAELGIVSPAGVALLGCPAVRGGKHQVRGMPYSVFPSQAYSEGVRVRREVLRVNIRATQTGSPDRRSAPRCDVWSGWPCRAGREPWRRAPSRPAGGSDVIWGGTGSGLPGPAGVVGVGDFCPIGAGRVEPVGGPGRSDAGRRVGRRSLGPWESLGPAGVARAGHAAFEGLPVKRSLPRESSINALSAP